MAGVADSLVVAEVFGPTVQGEGPSAGSRTSFLRLGGCNLHCSWCDSKFTWDASQYDLREQMTRRPVTDIADAIAAHNTGMVVITGGEPLLHQHQPAWRDLLGILQPRRIEVETNGTQAPTPLTAEAVSLFNVSPKLASAGDPESLRLDPNVIRTLLVTGKAVFKFVCATQADVTETAVVIARLGIPADLTWIMPEGTSAPTITERLAAIADPAIAAGFNLTTRLHVLAWGNERGR